MLCFHIFRPFIRTRKSPKPPESQASLPDIINEKGKKTIGKHNFLGKKYGILTYKESSYQIFQAIP